MIVLVHPSRSYWHSEVESFPFGGSKEVPGDVSCSPSFQTAQFLLSAQGVRTWQSQWSLNISKWWTVCLAGLAGRGKTVLRRNWNLTSRSPSHFPRSTVTACPPSARASALSSQTVRISTWTERSPLVSSKNTSCLPLKYRSTSFWFPPPRPVLRAPWPAVSAVSCLKWAGSSWRGPRVSVVLSVSAGAPVVPGAARDLSDRAVDGGLWCAAPVWTMCWMRAVGQWRQRRRRRVSIITTTSHSWAGPGPPLSMSWTARTWSSTTSCWQAGPASPPPTSATLSSPLWGRTWRARQTRTGTRELSPWEVGSHHSSSPPCSRYSTVTPHSSPSHPSCSSSKLKF